MIQRKDLSEEEKARPCVKYFYRQPTAPDPETGKLIQPGQPMDPSQALPFENINELLNPEYMEVETGYCILPNGAGYVAVNTKMPGVSVDMINWWFAWHCLEDLRHRLWWPAEHFGVSISGEDRAKILDPNVPMAEKLQGTTIHVIEDVGGGIEDIYFNFLTPEQMGFDLKRFQRSQAVSLFAANGIFSRVGAPADAPKAPATMCHLVWEMPGGIELRTRFWMGCHVIDGKQQFLLAPGFDVPEAAAYSLAIHCISEYSNLRAILPQLYTEQLGKLP